MDSAYAAAYPDLYRNHWWWRVREHILLGEIERLLVDVPQARILDVGCGAGLFFHALQRFGDVEGIESDPTALAAAGRWRSRIHHGELNASFSPQAPYHLILMLDVLEHLTRPVELLRQAAAHLHTGGRILITVPAFNWLWTRHDDVNHHVRRYTIGEMGGTVKAADLSVERSRYLFASLVLPKALVRFKEALLGDSPDVPRIPSAWVNGAVQRVLRVEHAITGPLPFGTSLMVVASRAAR
jgi:trans-aconitate methyltransferase